MEAMLNTKNKNKGQVLVLVALFLLFVGLPMLALAIDIAYFYHVRHQLQGAADAAALAGASFLTCENDTGTVFQNQTTARRMAWQFACKNKAAGANVYLATNSSTDCDSPPDAATLTPSSSSTGDIVVGNWNPTNNPPFTVADGGHPDLRINAVKVVARREEGKDYTGGGVVRFFGGIFNPLRQNINKGTTAIARGCFVKLSPISVNEYWLGKRTGDCGGPEKADSGSGKRTPYEVNHFYPNSFVRPPHGQPFGNVTTFSRIIDCRPNPDVPVIGASANGPLTSDCSDCSGRMTSTSGRVFAIVGGAADPNTSGQMYSLIDLDHRIGCSQGVGFGCDSYQQWYDFSVTPSQTEQSVAFAQVNPNKNVVAGYIQDGFYPHTLPVSHHEVFQPLYTDISPYITASPYATTAYFSGQGVTGQMVNQDFYDNGNYQGGKYAPGEEIIVAVYDGIVGDSGNQARTTIVGFATIKIFGYGSNLTVGSGVGSVSVSGPENTMYGYVERVEDSLKEINSVNDWFIYYNQFLIPGGRSILVE